MYTKNTTNRCGFSFRPLSAVSVHMNPGHSAARGVSGPRPGLVPSQGRGRGAGDRLVLVHKKRVCFPVICIFP